MQSDAHTFVSTEQFINTLSKYSADLTENTDFITYGYQAGWLQDMDVTGREFPLVRKNAARILHEFLRIELQESDISDISAAYRLQDLFDCRICVSHIMQMYAKGIMSGQHTLDNQLIFGVDKTISIHEMTEMINRAFHSELRIIPASVELSKCVTLLSLETAINYYKSAKNALLIDVRTYDDFSSHHLTHAINIPLMSILKNPYSVSSDRDILLLLYCNNGYQSEMAATCLADAGYFNVYYFAWEPTNI